MKTSRIALIALLGAMLATPVISQTGPGPGMGPGMGPGQGMGPGMGGRMAFDQSNTPGWALMTPEERAAHRNTMWSFKSYDECKAFQAEHHKAMEAKAKELGKTLPAPRANACERMQARGQFK